MLKNFFKVTFRALVKNSVANTINILGLAIGIACFLLIYINVSNEMSYDTFHTDAEQIYRITTIDEALGVSSNNVAITSPVLAKTAEAVLPEVVESARLNNQGRMGLEIDDRIVFTEHAKSVEPSFLQLFDFKLEDANNSSRFNAPYKAIVTNELAKKLSAEDEIIGSIINISDDDWEIVGVLADTDNKSHLEFDLLLSMYPSQADSSFAQYLDSWRGLGMVAYIKLAKGADPIAVTEKLNELTHENEVPEFWITKLQKLSDIHLKSADILFDGYNANKGDIVYVYSLSAIAIFIILIAVFNFMNLSTAKSSTRAKEVGVRKTVGAAKPSLVLQHLGEAVIICYISFFLALLVLGLLSPFLDLGFEENIIIYILSNTTILGGLILLVTTVGILAGIYPAFVLSNIKPVNILRGKFQTSSAGVWLRKILVVAQFVASVALIAITLLISKQISYLKNKDLGFSTAQVVTINMGDPSLRDNMVALRNTLMDFENVTAVSTSSNMPGRTFGRTGITPEGASEDDETWIVSAMSFDEHYFAVMNMEIVEGRNYAPEFGTDEDAAILINESFVEQLGWEDPIGKKLSFGDDSERTILGVVKDFHYASMRHAIEPLVMYYQPEANRNLSILINSDITATMRNIEGVWQEQYQDYPMEYEFFDQEFGQMFKSDENFSSLVYKFTWLAIFIACLGLFGLSAYIAEQRRKEIGIRKVLGSNVQQAAILITREFVVLISIAIILALPVSYFALQEWLGDFQYHIELWSISSLLIYLLAASATFILGVITVSYQAISAALVNPADSIKAA
jgi:putative ABC transport system permease protein